MVSHSTCPCGDGSQNGHFSTKDDVNLTAWWAYVDEVNKKSNGEVVIKFVGGPEAIPAFKPI